MARNHRGINSQNPPKNAPWLPLKILAQRSGVHEATVRSAANAGRFATKIIDGIVQGDVADFQTYRIALARIRESNAKRETA